jgi:serine/threonine protein kinase
MSLKYQSSESILEKYDVGQAIGQGSFSVVKGAISKDEQEKPVAIKIISKEKAPSLDSIYFEIETMIQLKQHPNVLHVYDVFESQEQIYLVLELAHSELVDWIGKNSSELIARDVVRQLLSALNYLHQRRFVHCDLKPENVLVSLDFNQSHHVFLSDFGLVQQLENKPNSTLSKRYGSPSNFAPEIVNKQEYNEKIDIWSLGVLTFELLIGVHPFLNSDGVDETELMKRITTRQFSWPTNSIPFVSDVGKSFVDSLICLDANKRPSSEEALNHGWFSAPVSELTPKPMIVSETNKANNINHDSATDGGGSDKNSSVDDHSTTGSLRPKAKKEGNIFTRSLRKGLMKLGLIQEKDFNNETSNSETKQEKRSSKDEKRNSRNEKRNSENEKRKSDNEKRKSDNEKRGSRERK